MDAVDATGAPVLEGDLVVAWDALSALGEAWEAAVDELGSTVPPAQLRALMAIAADPPLSMTTLARRLRASTSAASRLCDRLQQAGLIVRHSGQPDRRGVRLSVTPAGGKLAAWVRDQRQTRLVAVVARMTPAARGALIDALRGPSATARQPVRDRDGAVEQHRTVVRTVGRQRGSPAGQASPERSSSQGQGRPQPPPRPHMPAADQLTLCWRSASAPEHALQVRRRFAGLAGSLAQAEARLADTLEENADRRPHCARRVRAEASAVRQNARTHTRWASVPVGAPVG